MNLHPGRHPLPPPVAIQKRADLIPQKTRLLPAIMIEIIPAKTPKQKFMPASTHPKRDQTSRQRKEPDRFIFEKKLLDIPRDNPASRKIQRNVKTIPPKNFRPGNSLLHPKREKFQRLSLRLIMKQLPPS